MILLLLLLLGPAGADQEKNPEVLYQRAARHYRKGRYLATIRDASRSIAEAPKRHKTFMLRGHAYMRVKRYRAAAQDFRWALERDRQSMAAFMFYYLACEKDGRRPDQQLQKTASKRKDPVLLMYTGRILPQAYLSTVEMSGTDAKHRNAAMLQAKFFVGHYYRLRGVKRYSRRLLRRTEGRELDFLWAI